jgi:hypothetical protein
MVHFFTVAEIEKLLGENGLTIERVKREWSVHRMHWYVARKRV